jgi:hypothetical protein
MAGPREGIMDKYELAEDGVRRYAAMEAQIAVLNDLIRAQEGLLREYRELVAILRQGVQP